uniref:Uncharacterized protein n=1 Tax=Acrobeloides nanus TaxID=290746 RepID=A0A914E8U6_9BILA
MSSKTSLNESRNSPPSFVPTTSQPRTLIYWRLIWKSISQIAMEKRALAMHHLTRGHRNLPEAIVLCSEEDRRRARTEDIAAIPDPTRFKNAVKSSTVYEVLARKGIARRAELMI